MKRWLFLLGSLAVLNAPAQHIPKNTALLFGTTRDDYDPGVGAAWIHDLTDRIAIFVSLESVRFDDTSSYGDDSYFAQTTTEADGYEVQLGYLHRIWSQENGLSLQLGPAIGLEELEGKTTSAYSGPYGSGKDRTDLDYDLGLNAYVQAMVRYAGFKSVELFASAAYGYRSGREVEYSGGGPIVYAEASGSESSMVPGYSSTEGSESFLRVALGVAIPF